MPGLQTAHPESCLPQLPIDGGSIAAGDSDCQWRLESGVEAATAIHIVLDRDVLMFNRVFLFISCITSLEVPAFEKFVIPVLDRILRSLALPANGRAVALPYFEIEICRP